MFDHVSIGPSPTNEQCAQVGEDDYHERSVKECRAYVRQLRRALGEEPEGASLAVKSNSHDFGVYREVVCYYADNCHEAVDYAFRAEEQAPAEWDDEARAELGLGVEAAVPV
jgi:pyruvate dehydrogenase complex dehydrogenase (E1) component